MANDLRELYDSVCQLPNRAREEFGMRPDKQLNFFENYIRHCNYLDKSAFKDFAQVIEAREPLNALAKVAGKHATFFEPLRDSHDYVDQIMGLTVLPIIAMVTAAAFMINTIIAGVFSLACMTGLKKGSATTHADMALNNFIYSGVTLVAGLAVGVKSAINLVTRPCATIVNGWKPQNKVRFADESTQESLVDMTTKLYNARNPCDLMTGRSGYSPT
jgi:hypothetical protein